MGSRARFASGEVNSHTLRARRYRLYKRIYGDSAAYAKDELTKVIKFGLMKGVGGEGGYLPGVERLKTTGGEARDVSSYLDQVPLCRHQLAEFGHSITYVGGGARERGSPVSSGSRPMELSGSANDRERSTR